MRGYKTKEEMMRNASAESNSTHKSTEKKSKKVPKAWGFIIFLLILGVCIIISYNHILFLENNSNYEYADSDFVANDSVLTDSVADDSVADETVITNDENEERELLTGVHNGHEWVDLGLSVKWATCNIGAKAYYEYGNYFTWGDINSIKHDEYCKTFDEEIYDIEGDKEYDAALSHWGGQWRLPTKTEFEELIEKCTMKEKVVGKYNGCLVTGPNGNSIFLPMAGFSQNAEFDDKFVGEEGNYWSATSNDKECAYYLQIEYGNVLHVYSEARFYGSSIRPVYDNKDNVKFDDL